MIMQTEDYEHGRPDIRDTEIGHCTITSDIWRSIHKTVGGFVFTARPPSCVINTTFGLYVVSRSLYLANCK